MTTLLRRTPLRRVALGVAGLALGAASLTACGGDSDTDDASASASASQSASASPSETATQSPSESAATSAAGSEFCGVYGELFDDLTEALSAEGGPDLTEVGGKLEDYADRLEAAGLPDGVPDDARQGFEASLQAIRELPDNPTQEDLLAAGEGASAEEQASANAFGQYVITACPDLVPEVPTPTS